MRTANCTVVFYLCMALEVYVYVPITKDTQDEPV